MRKPHPEGNRMGRKGDNTFSFYQTSAVCQVPPGKNKEDTHMDKYTLFRMLLDLLDKEGITVKEANTSGYCGDIDISAEDRGTVIEIRCSVEKREENGNA